MQYFIYQAYAHVAFKLVNCTTVWKFDSILIILCTAVFSEMCFACFSGSHNRVNQCPVNEHGCLDPDVCIHMSKLCDGVPDCTDGWDEGPHCRGKKKKLTEACKHIFNTSLTSIFCRRDHINIFLYLLCGAEMRVSALFWVKNHQPASCCEHLLVFPFKTLISIQ